MGRSPRFRKQTGSQYRIYSPFRNLINQMQATVMDKPSESDAEILIDFSLIWFKNMD